MKNATMTTEMYKGFEIVTEANSTCSQVIKNGIVVGGAHAEDGLPSNECAKMKIDWNLYK